MATDPTDMESEGKDSLASRAERCRRLAAGISDRQAADVLRKMAQAYERQAELPDER